MKIVCSVLNEEKMANRVAEMVVVWVLDNVHRVDEKDDMDRASRRMVALYQYYQ